jgi:hypothetical protein
MPQIVEEVYYVGTKERIGRLGLISLVDEIRSALTGFQLLVREQVHANSRAAVRSLLDAQFSRLGGWATEGAYGIDWTKSKVLNGTRVCIGVEVQVSARSSLLLIDMLHLRTAFRDGLTDVGLVIVASDKLSRLLTDRAPSISDAKKLANAARLEDSSLVLFGIEHDGTGPPLAKQTKKASGT